MKTRTDAETQIEGKLAGKVAAVTGATSGFGTAIARLFAAEGAALVLGAAGRGSKAGRQPRWAT